MTSTNGNQKDNHPMIGEKSKKDEHPEINTSGAGTLILWIEEKFLSLIGSKAKRDGQPKKKTGAGAFVFWLKHKLVSFTGSKAKDGHPEKTPGAGTPIRAELKKDGRPHKTGHAGTPFWWGILKKDGRPSRTDTAGTP